ncbi:MAG: type IV pilus secretin PilQ [Mariprofundales bacterium]|nr:type IV pilus secretin PilQ [Mariprofundales bacterium]
MDRMMKKCLMLCCCMMVAVSLPVSARAAQLSGITLVPALHEDILTIQSDEPAPYQVFDLKAPARLVLSFSATTIGDVTPPEAGRAILATRLLQQGDSAVVELTLAPHTTYTIAEEGNNLLIHLPVAAAPQKRQMAQIDDLSVVDQGSNSDLVLRGSLLDRPFTARMANHGTMMIVDIPDTTSRLAKEHFSYASQIIRDVTIGSHKGKTRMVISLLKSSVSHQISATSSEFHIHFGVPRSLDAKMGEQQLGADVGASGMVVEGVDFQPEDRISHVILTLNRENAVVDLQHLGETLRMSVRGGRLKQGLERTMDVSAFPGAVKQIDTFQQGDDVQVVVRLRDRVSVSTFQRGKVIAINIEPHDMAAARAQESGDNSFFYSGDKVTFDFKDIDIKNALRLIAEMSSLNMIMADDVSGKLTMRLIDVPWDQALDLILTSKGLGKEQVGNVMRIAPIDALRSEYKTRLAVQKGAEALEPLVTEFITLNFTKVAAVKTMIASAAANASKVAAATGSSNSSSGGGEKKVAPSGGILSPRGSILTDARTNTLIVKDTQVSIDNVKRLIAAIDQPVRQVLIAARVVEASSDFNRDIGIQWGGTYNAQSQRNFPGAVSIGQPAAAQANATAIAGGGGIASATTKGFLVDLPATAANAIGISLGSFNNAINLDLALSAAELNGSAKVVSNPRIVTTNLKPATISQGTKIAVVTSQGANNAATTTYVDATLNLTVTPQITSKNTVLMDVTISKDSPVGTSANINTKTVTTNVNVKSGETVVIGGVYEHSEGDTKQSVPGLASIPFLGYLFQKNAKIDNRTELLIFITPQIMNSAVTGGE